MISCSRRVTWLIGILTLLSGVRQAEAQQFLDIVSLSPGTPGGAGSRGSFSGTLGGVAVNGSLATGVAGPDVSLTATGSGFESSVTDNTSPQYSYSTVYSPFQANVDQVGYVLFPPIVAGSRVLTITFASAIVNPVFHVANLDSMIYDFSPTTTAANLSLLSGNGGGGDGLALVGTVLQDANPTTVIGVSPGTPPPTSGARSAYGSMQLLGSYTTLTVNLGFNPNATDGDGGSFTLSVAPATAAIPEPGPLALAGASLLAVAGVRLVRRRNRTAA